MNFVRTPPLLRKRSRCRAPRTCLQHPPTPLSRELTLANMMAASSPNKAPHGNNTARQLFELPRSPLFDVSYFQHEGSPSSHSQRSDRPSKSQVSNDDDSFSEFIENIEMDKALDCDSTVCSLKASSLALGVDDDHSCFWISLVRRTLIRTRDRDRKMSVCLLQK